MECPTGSGRDYIMQAFSIPLKDHLTRREIFDRYRCSLGAEERTYWQVIYLKSLGKVFSDIAQVTGFDPVWVRRLIRRYNEVGPDTFATDLPPALASPEQQADYARKTQELAKASTAQQALLSPPIPDHPDLDIAAFMRTAYEVGGDYYDFKSGPDNALTVAIGEATGHGIVAGMMVAATKTLFILLGQSPDLLDTVRKISRTLKALNLRGLYMHLTLGRYHEGILALVAAGMPSPFFYHKDAGTVHQISLRGAPLGSFTSFPYERHTVSIAPGDTILLVSDGVTELVNPAGEMLTSERVQRIFEECCHRSAQDILRTVRRAGRAWRAEQPMQDDATILVLKRKEQTA